MRLPHASPRSPLAPVTFLLRWEAAQTDPQGRGGVGLCQGSPVISSAHCQEAAAGPPQTEDRPKGSLISLSVVHGFVGIRLTIPRAWSEGFSYVYRVGQLSLQSRVEHPCHPRKKNTFTYHSPPLHPSPDNHQPALCLWKFPEVLCSALHLPQVV